MSVMQWRCLLVTCRCPSPYLRQVLRCQAVYGISSMASSFATATSVPCHHCHHCNRCCTLGRSSSCTHTQQAGLILGHGCLCPLRALCQVLHTGQVVKLRTRLLSDILDEHQAPRSIEYL